MIVVALLAACLPHGALGAGTADLVTSYLLESDGQSYPLTRQWARAFSDGSNGWIVCVEAAGAHCAELRAFHTGEVLALRGMAAWPADVRALTAGLWPVLSARVNLTSGLVSSWPIGGPGRDETRLVATGAWAREGRRFGWSPTLAVVSATGWTGSGHFGATVMLDGTEVVEGTWALEITLCRAGGACQPLVSRGALRTTPAAAVLRAAHPCPQRGESGSRAPLCLADGTVLDDAGAAGGTP